jgi:hypothetical protein
MSRFLRINKTVIHVPSLANVSMAVDCFGYPSLQLYYHTQKTQTLKCGDHTECEKQMMRIKKAMKVIEHELESIPLVEPAEQEPSAPLNTTNVLPT